MPTQKKSFTDMELGVENFGPNALDMADQAKIVPAEMETPIKASPVKETPLKERLHASKPWKPKGRK